MEGSWRGLLCNGNAVYQAYFADQGTKVLIKDPDCGPPSPTALLLGPSCHRRSATLVCLLRGFSYPWPLEVSWTRDDEEVQSFAAATEPLRALPGNCNFGTASRLSVPAEDWLAGRSYSCHARQGDAQQEVKSAGLRAAGQKKSGGPSEMLLSLRTGQFIFLFLIAKSFAYGAALGIYLACRKPGV